MGPDEQVGEGNWMGMAFGMDELTDKERAGLHEDAGEQMDVEGSMFWGQGSSNPPGRPCKGP